MDEQKKKSSYTAYSGVHCSNYTRAQQYVLECIILSTGRIVRFYIILKKMRANQFFVAW